MVAAWSASIASTDTAALTSLAERTSYNDTSRYADVAGFFEQLQKRTTLLRCQSFGHSHEGRPLPLEILADPPVFEPGKPEHVGKPVVLVLANIHAGEVEGKEAAQHLARRLLLGDLRPLLEKLVILIVPIYNADGNERINLAHRPEQNGPIQGVGTRENAQGLDLNRDFIKAEAPETQALIKLLNHWDPHLVVDLHTTDGSYHGYHLTYAPPLNPSLNTELLDYHRERLLPALTQAMLARHKFRTYYYGNFTEGHAASATSPPSAWHAFSAQPRVGYNYFGFRNRLAILTEAYSYLDFRRRVEVTEAWLEEILRYASDHAEELLKLTRAADAEAVGRAPKGAPLIGVEYQPKALPEPVPILVGEITQVTNPNSGAPMTAMVEEKFTPVKMLDFGMFAAVRSVPAPRAYGFRREPGTKILIEKLLLHGIRLDELSTRQSLEIRTFYVASWKAQEPESQGHHEIKLKGNYVREVREFMPGTIVVRTNQRLGLLAAYLIDPESEDGLVVWNFLDSYLGEEKMMPVFKMMGDELPKTTPYRP